jgi:hypothetical protein
VVLVINPNIVTFGSGPWGRGSIPSVAKHSIFSPVKRGLQNRRVSTLPVLDAGG